MKVRRANFTDLADMLSLMAEYHETSNLSDVPFIRKDAARVLDYHITHKDCCPLIARDDNGDLKGLLCAEMVPFFFNKKEFFASDMQFISHGAGMHLLRAFKEWAFNTGANRIIMAVSSGDARADAFLELSGLEKTGNMYVLHR